MPGRRTLFIWSAGLIAAALALWIVLTWWASIWAWLPWTDKARREAAEARADIAEADARSEGARATGEAETGRAIERHTIIVRAADRVAADAEIEARTASDANTPIDPDRARRLLDAQRGLCAVAPTICAEARPDPSDG